MGGHGLTGPDRARFGGRAVAHSEHEVHERCTRLSKFAPVLAPTPVGRQPVIFEQLQRPRVYPSGWLAPGAKSFKLVPSETRQDRLRHDAPRRITGTNAQNVKSL